VKARNQGIIFSTVLWKRAEVKEKREIKDLEYCLVNIK